jgi:hypothetical protein
MARSILDIEQELETLRKDEVKLRMQQDHWINLLPTDPSVRQSLDTVNQLMLQLLTSQNNKIEEIKVLREKGMILMINIFHQMCF